ncbi:MlaD family protein [Marinobacter sp. C2H3]|uniref:MlaD family protein n=1 Tax=Marinobacter sp. C2H3 TaxID=3119003 RepID=UPI00300F1C12
MEPRAHHVIIGLFTVLAAAAALLFALWLAKSSSDREWAYYQIGFDHPVSGLAKGNPVLYSGVPVGEVLGLTLDPKDPSHVRVRIRVDDTIPIRKNTHVGLVLANITGSMNVQFRGGSPDSPRLKGRRDDPPLIMADPSPFTNLLSNGSNLLEKADQFLTRANRVFSEDNLDNLSGLLANGREATDALLSQRQQLLDLLEQFNAAAQRAEQAARKVSTTSDNANRILIGKVAPVLNAMDRALGTLQPTLDRLESLTASNEGALDAGMQGLGELGPTLRELRSVLRNLNRFAKRLETNPPGALLGTPALKEMEP